MVDNKKKTIKLIEIRKIQNKAELNLINITLRNKMNIVKWYL